MSDKLKFQSTLSVRRATLCTGYDLKCSAISIHALREESDMTVGVGTVGNLLISIHALREESDTS